MINIGLLIPTTVSTDLFVDPIEKELFIQYIKKENINSDRLDIKELESLFLKWKSCRFNWEVNCNYFEKGIYYHCYKGIYYRFIKDYFWFDNRHISVWELSDGQNFSISCVAQYGADHFRIDECFELFIESLKSVKK